MTQPYQENYSKTFPITDNGFMMQLAASTALSITVPGTANQTYRVKFNSSYTAEIWVARNKTAVLPTSGTATAVSGQEFLPKYDEARYAIGGDTLSFISATTPQVGVSFLLVDQT